MHVSHTMGRIEALLIEVLATQPWFWLRMDNRPNSGSARHGRKPRNRRRRGGVREVAA